MWEFNLPRLDLQEGSPELQQVKSYLFQLTDQLKYLFSAVDVENLAPELYEAYQNAMSLPNQVSSLQENTEQELVKLHNEDKTHADKVVEEGVSNSWYYRKWDSGRCEAWRNYDHVTDNLVSLNGWYYDFTGSISLPFTFKSLRNFQVSVSRPTGAAWAVGNTAVPASNATSVMVLTIQSGSTSNTQNLSLSVSGTWK